MKKFLHEFKEFALRGNVMDLAVGVIIGAAFQKIVNSLVTDIITPLIGLFAKQDFNDLVLNVLGVDIKYGAFITNVLNFIIMAFIVFLIVKGMNAVASFGRKKEAAEEEVTTKVCPYCFSEIDRKAMRCPHCTSVLTKGEGVGMLADTPEQTPED